jgi:hypothetical protein
MANLFVLNSTSGLSNRDRVAKKRDRSYTAALDGTVSSMTAADITVLRGEMVLRILPGLKITLGLIPEKFLRTESVFSLNFIISSF